MLCLDYPYDNCQACEKIWTQVWKSLKMVRRKHEKTSCLMV
jgi:hypothetical protein